MGVAVLLAGCGGDGDEPTDATGDGAAGSTAPAGAGDAPGGAGAVGVEVRTFAFRPPMLETGAGTAVTWTNGDAAQHTVTSGTPDAPSDAFDLELDGAGSTVSHRFAAAGTFEYFCRRHPSMTGTVTVT